ncbi:DUF805 domain-containing protein [Yoonia sp. R2331]|uniref:DUF805 domain-containing protein n=1 Tax=Yoonia sp. R2331 TaxID=3237238 RepID=UPI0034E3C536
MTTEQWHYVDGGDSRGPFSMSQIEGLIRSGTIAGHTLVWNENLPVWEPAARHFDFQDGPPPIGAAASGGVVGHDGLYVGAPARGFAEALKVCFSKYATFSGRASRSEYWYFVLWQFLIGFVTGFVDGFILGATGDFSPLNSIASLVLLLPTLAVSWRRLHDVNRSGWWIGGFYIVLFATVALGFSMYADVPLDAEPAGSFLALAGLFGIGFLVYTIVILVFFCTRGTPGPNRFG